MILLVNGSKVDLSADSPVSLKYELNSTTDLSCFTTVYSSDLSLPLTNNNRVIFNHPDPSSIDSYFPFVLYNDTFELVDEGKLVITEVSDFIHCHLYGALVSLNDELTNFNTLAATLQGSQAVNKDNQLVTLSTVPLVASQFSSTQDHTLHLDGTDNYQGLLNFYKANIGKPSDFDASHYYDSATQQVVDCGDRTILSAPSPTPSQSHQYRVYHLTPAIPSLVLFYNLFNASSFDITLSNEVQSLLQNVGYVGPSLNSVFSFAPSELRWVHESTVTSTSSAFKVKDLLSVPSVGLTAVPDTAHYYLVTISDGTHSYSILYYPDIYGWDWNQFESIVTYPFDEAIPFNDRLNEVTIPILNNPTNPVTYSITYNTYIVNSDETYTYKPQNQVWFYGETGYYTFTPSYYVSSPDDLTFSYQTYFASIPKPWDICKNICKRYNLRLKSIGIGEYQIVLGTDYYNNAINLFDYVDIKDEAVVPTPFSTHRIRFKDTPVDSLWFSSYKSMFEKTYGQVELITSYPVESTSDWLSNPLKFFVSPDFNFYPWNQSNPTTIEKIGEAYNKDGSQVDVSGSLCYLPGAVFSGVHIFDNLPIDSQCWYDAASQGTSIAAVPHLSSCDGSGNSLFSYGQALANPEGYRCIDNLSSHFGDVIDSVTSSQITLGVFIDRIHLSMPEFISSFFTFHNNIWIVSSVSSYVPGWNEVTPVTFIRVNDITKYLPSDTATVSVTVSPDEGGSVTGAGTYDLGSTCHLVATASTGYEFDHWSDGSTEHDRSFVVLHNVSLTAYFTSSVRKLFSIQSDTGTVVSIIDGVQHVGNYSESVREDTTITIQYIPGQLDVFDHWDEDVAGIEITDNPYTFTLVDDVSFVAQSHVAYYFTVNQPAHGAADVVVAGTTHEAPYSARIPAGTHVVVNYYGNNETYTFKDWYDSIEQYRYQYPTWDILSLESSYNLTAEFDTHYWATLGAMEHGTIDAVAINGVYHNLPYEIQPGDRITAAHPAPAEGYLFDHYVINGRVDIIPYTANGDTQLVAVFTDRVYSLRVTQGSLGTATTIVDGVSHTGNYSATLIYGKQVTISYVPNAHVSFDYWQDTATGTKVYSTSHTFSMQNNHSFVAVAHVIPSYTLLKVEPQHGTLTDISVNGSVITTPCTVYDGDIITSATATPDTGYYFGGYTVNGSVTTLPYTIHSGVQFSAVFTETVYTLSLGTTAHGTISNVRVNGNLVSLPIDVHYGDVVTADVTPDVGYNFASFTVNGLDTTLPYTVTGNTALGARYTLKLYTFNFSTPPIGGNITNVRVNGSRVILPPIQVHHFDMVTAEYTLQPGYKFDSFTVNGNDVSLPYIVISDTNLSVRFSLQDYTLSQASIYHGSISVKVNGVSVSLPTTIHYGDIITATATPESGYNFGYYTINGTVSELPYTAYGDVVIGAVFRPSTSGPLRFKSIDGGSVSMVQEGSWEGTWTIEYSRNNTNWYTYSLGTELSISQGESVYFRGEKDSTSQERLGNYRRFVIRGRTEVSGDCTTLLNREGSVASLYNYGDGTFAGLFYQCLDMISAPSVNSEYLTYYCYYAMFSETGIETPPDLPSHNLSYRCYESMFEGCQNLNIAPALPATVLAEYCYSNMFLICTSLVSAPALPATTLANWCYAVMFSYCTSLVNPPALPATTLATNCYAGMFIDCTKLTGPVSISATSPYSSETTSACTGMFASSGTASSAGGNIYVGGNLEEWTSSTCGINITREGEPIDPPVWTIQQLP